MTLYVDLEILVVSGSQKRESKLLEKRYALLNLYYIKPSLNSMRRMTHRPVLERCVLLGMQVETEGTVRGGVSAAVQ